MKYKILIALVVSILVFTACQIDEIDTYSGDNYIYFSQEGEEAIEYSFSFNPGKDQDTILLEVKLIGFAADYDREIALTVNESETTAEDSDYSLPSNIVFGAGCYIDTIPIVVYNTDKLAEQKYTLFLQINDGKELLSGPPENSYVEIIFSDMISKPDWWDSTVESNFLGTYSDEKYRLFIEATGVIDMTDFSESEMRAYALIFRDFLQEGREQGEEYVDENGDPITVPSGLFT